MLELKDLKQLPQFWEWKEEQQKGAKTTLLISILIDIIFGLFIILNLVNFNFAKEIMLAVMIILTLFAIFYYKKSKDIKIYNIFQCVIIEKGMDIEIQYSEELEDAFANNKGLYLTLELEDERITTVPVGTDIFSQTEEGDLVVLFNTSRRKYHVLPL